jgi:hypothetical protein
MSHFDSRGRSKGCSKQIPDKSGVWVIKFFQPENTSHHNLRSSYA